ncbi:MAG: hydroxymethylglutaryl-CoA synthase [Deltaproteobacteria bacterium]|nr:hydroxymethylglutaryl-CoA synthase [Deltaproteobacteria bacterium]
MPDARPTDVGIEALFVDLPRQFLDLGTLARANGVDPEKYYFGLGGRRMAVPAPDEDPVVLASNAARGVLAAGGVAPTRVGLVVVGTESAVDGSKPIAAWVHRAADLPSDCRVFDVQHACYGGTAALGIALDWIASRARPGRKALVIATDVARYEIGSPGEPTQGGGAVALLVGDEPRVVRFEDHPEAVHAEEVADFWRPTYRSTAVVDGSYSLECYLRALDGCWGRFRRDTGRRFSEFEHLLFHAPFPKMAFKAHRRLFEAAARAGELPSGAEPGADFERRVLPTLWANAEVGNAYTASLYLSLAGLLENDAVDAAGARLGLFAYGSGSCAEFLAARVGDDAAAWRGRTGLRQALRERRELSHAEYLQFRAHGEELSRNGTLRVPTRSTGPAFCGTWEHRRVYRDEALAVPGSSSQPLGRDGRSAR